MHINVKIPMTSKIHWVFKEQVNRVLKSKLVLMFMGVDDHVPINGSSVRLSSNLHLKKTYIFVTAPSSIF